MNGVGGGKSEGANETVYYRVSYRRWLLNIDTNVE